MFPDIKTKLADPVGIPLPAEYTDEPTIPPAYDATCIKSEYFKEHNQEEFARSIRDQPSWATLQHDPAFKHYSGMVMRRFPGNEHEYPSYDPSDPPDPSAPITMPPRFQTVRSSWKAPAEERAPDKDSRNDRNAYPSRRSPQNQRPRDDGRERSDADGIESRRPPKRSLDAHPEENNRDDREFKRSRLSQPQRGRSRDGNDRAVSPPRKRSPSPKFDLTGDPWSPQAGETSIRSSREHRHQDTYNDTRSSSSREERVSFADKRHDSGYYSGSAFESRAYRDHERDHRRSSRSYQRRKTSSGSRSRSPSRGRSRASTPARSDRSRSESPLTALEAELLGLTEEPSEPRPKPVAKKPIRRVKVAEAFR